MRVGVLGGTFDPVHLGHLVLAEQCREQAQLEQVWFVPAARPPHKQEYVLTSFEHRAEMLALALAGQPAFRIDDLEKGRPGPSYTVDTLAELARRNPGVELFFIVGADCLPDLPHWHEPQRLADLATLLIAARPGWSVGQSGDLQNTLSLSPGQVLRQQLLQIPLIDISSRDLRQRVAEGHSIRYLVPRAVECYIGTHRLYGAK
jgi:nicotinate-nucleotide adenylyltransferase